MRRDQRFSSDVAKCLVFGQGKVYQVLDVWGKMDHRLGLLKLEHAFQGDPGIALGLSVYGDLVYHHPIQQAVQHP